MIVRKGLDIESTHGSEVAAPAYMAVPEIQRDDRLILEVAGQ